MSGKFHETNIVNGVTGNGDFPVDGLITAKGDRIISFFGDLGGANVKFVFFCEKPGGELEEMPESPDWEFTSKPAPERYSFSYTLPFKIRVSGATGSTNFGISLHELD